MDYTQDDATLFEPVPMLYDADLARLESTLDFRQFTMTADEYAAALFLDSIPNS